MWYEKIRLLLSNRCSDIQYFLAILQQSPVLSSADYFLLINHPPTHPSTPPILQPEYDELYWTVGDGGPQNDPYNMAQDPANFHGKVIRILVPSRAYGTGYKIPSGNAFAGANGM